jgi:arsenite methyltransferase
MTLRLGPTFNPDDPDHARSIDELSWWASQFGNLLLDQVPVKTGIRVLDLGTGTGFPVMELATRQGASGILLGLDIWRPGLLQARKKKDIHRIENLNLVQADAVELPLADGCIDLIVSNVGVNNFAEPKDALRETFRVAAKGATLVLSTNLKGHMVGFYRLFREVLREMEKTQALVQLQEEEAHRTTRAGLEKMVSDAGFRIQTCREAEFALRYADGAALLGHPLTRFGFLSGWMAVVDPDEQEPVFQRLQERLDREAADRGELRMNVPMLCLEATRP